MSQKTNHTVEVRPKDNQVDSKYLKANLPEHKGQ